MFMILEAINAGKDFFREKPFNSSTSKLSKPQTLPLQFKVMLIERSVKVMQGSERCAADRRLGRAKAQECWVWEQEIRRCAAFVPTAAPPSRKSVPASGQPIRQEPGAVFIGTRTACGGYAQQTGTDLPLHTA
ncbi:hypothetical protein CKAH01_18033 [Colletotrichum kahawae]|uniref:Uncharacterized protein n=1 Tax=Colletotrichum kahawae TaxID=34407 RepID=A0AAE0D3M9_COLKA|nr:hypothetical protein CKAH01_18033 [Colletotrichum kahawae]